MHAVLLDSVAHGLEEVLSAPQPTVSGREGGPSHLGE